MIAYSSSGCVLGELSAAKTETTEYHYNADPVAYILMLERLHTLSCSPVVTWRTNNNWIN